MTDMKIMSKFLYDTYIIHLLNVTDMTATKDIIYTIYMTDMT